MVKHAVRRAVMTAFCAVLVSLGIALVAPSAHAATYDHRFTNEVPGGCASNVRVGQPKSIYGPDGMYYGWGEFRLGTNGECTGYQWVKLHFTKDMSSPGGLDLYIHRGTDRTGGIAVHTHLKTDFFAKGTYTQSQVLYSVDGNKKIVRSATVYGKYPVLGELRDITFGTSGNQYEWING